MSMLSRLIPRLVRERLRPVRRRFRLASEDATGRLRASIAWTRPPEIQSLLTELARPLSIHDLYCIGQREFVVLQLEQEITGFLEYIAAERPRVAGEIGLKWGGNSFLFLRVLQELRLFVGIDLALTNIGKLRCIARPGARLQFIEGNSCADDTVTRVRRSLGTSQFDFLFIDGDHSYAGALADFKTYCPLVRPGGLIAFHDIVPDEMVRLGKRSADIPCDGGEVYLLWRKLRERFEHREFVANWDQFGFGIGVLRKPLESMTCIDDL
jgi:cephalosporin hydroxylase